MVAFNSVGTSAVSLFALAVLVATAASAQADCKPAAIAQGDPALVQSLIAKLTASGIATSQVAGCPVVHVVLDQRGQQLHLKLADAYQRGGERDVQDVSTAAAIIESWTLQEVEAGTLPAEAVTRSAVSVPIRATPHLVRHGIGVSLVSALGSNGGTTWIGGSMSGCVRLGPVCTGAALRAETDTRITGATTTFNQDSYAVSALATFDLPRRLRSLVLSPGIGLGYGYLHVTTHHHDAMNNQIDVPNADHQLRTGLHAALLYALGDHISAFGDLWGELAIARSDSTSGPGSSLRLLLGIRLEAP